MDCPVLSIKCSQFDAAACPLHLTQKCIHPPSHPTPLPLFKKSELFPSYGQLGFIALDLETQRTLVRASCHVRWVSNHVETAALERTHRPPGGQPSSAPVCCQRNCQPRGWTFLGIRLSGALRRPQLQK